MISFFPSHFRVVISFIWKLQLNAFVTVSIPSAVLTAWWILFKLHTIEFTLCGTQFRGFWKMHRILRAQFCHPQNFLLLPPLSQVFPHTTPDSIYLGLNRFAFSKMYKWDHAICRLLGLATSTYQNPFQIHTHWFWISTFFFLCSVPFYGIVCL